MEHTLTKWEGIGLLLGYAALMLLLTRLFTRGFGNTLRGYLVANRSLGVAESSFSIAATWIWAPALFIAAQQAYQHGTVGLLWFTVPNVLCLIIFAWFADRARRQMPEGFTLSGFIRERHSPRVQGLYLIELTGLAACSFAVQLLAGGTILTHLTGLPYFAITLLMTVIVLGYTWLSGIKASVITDYAQMVIILLVAAILVPWAVMRGGGMATVLDGMGGIGGNFRDLFSADSWAVAISFGIPTTIGLLAGPFGDQSFWQRAFSVREGGVKRAFIFGALIFVLVPLTLSLLGFIAAGNGWQVENAGQVNLYAVQRLLPAWVLIPFVYMLFSGLMSTLDSNLSAIAGLTGHDLFRGAPSRLLAHEVGDGQGAYDRQALAASRRGMLFLALAALLIANIPGITILHLFLFYGTLRASTLLPTVITLLNHRVRERAMFWGILISMCVGLPLFAWGKLIGNDLLALAASLFTVLASGIIVLVSAYMPGREPVRKGVKPPALP